MISSTVFYLLVSITSFVLAGVSAKRYLTLGYERFIYTFAQSCLYGCASAFCALTSFLEIVPIVFSVAFLSQICLFIWISSWATLERKQHHHEFFRVMTTLVLSLTLLLGIAYLLKNINYRVFSWDFKIRITSAEQLLYVPLSFNDKRVSAPLTVFPILQLLFLLTKIPYLAVTRQLKKDIIPISIAAAVSIFEMFCFKTSSYPVILKYWKLFGVLFSLAVLSITIYICCMSHYKSLAQEQCENSLLLMTRTNVREEQALKLVKMIQKRVERKELSKLLVAWCCFKQTLSVCKAIKLYRTLSKSL